MNDAMLMERLEEALDAPRRADLPSTEGPAAVDRLRAKADEIITGGEEWLRNVKQGVSRARKHKDHRTHFGQVWAHLEPILGRAINARENFVRQLDALIDQASSLRGDEAAELGKHARRMSRHILKEHRFLVDLYYQLKADADDADPETRGGNEVLSTPDDVRAYFKRNRAA